MRDNVLLFLFSLSCFTSALVKHVSASSGDDENYERMKRKIHKLLQLGVIPEDVVGL
jgi:hypothetical protein